MTLPLPRGAALVAFVALSALGAPAGAAEPAPYAPLPPPPSPPPAYAAAAKPAGGRAMQVQTRQGALYRGDLVAYEPSVGVTLSLAGGRTVSIAAADVLSLAPIDGPEAPPQEAAAPNDDTYVELPAGPEAMTLQQSVQGVSGPVWRPLCAAPCRMRVGRAFHYRLDGPGLVTSDAFVLPAAWNAVRIEVDAAHSARKIGGIAATLTGAGSALYGLVFLAASSAGTTRDSTTSQDRVLTSEERGALRGVGSGLLVLGVVALAVGIPLWVGNAQTQVGVAPLGAPPAPPGRVSLGRGVSLGIDGLTF